MSAIRGLRVSYALVVLSFIAGLSGCGGGGGGGGSGGAPAPAPLVAATSPSFSPTTGRDRATNTRNVPLRWVYAVNDGLPVTATLNGVTVSITAATAEMTIDPVDLRRKVVIDGDVTGSQGGNTATGRYKATIGEKLRLGAGQTFFEDQTLLLDMTLSQGNQSGTLNLNMKTINFVPDYEWFLDRTDLDQLSIGQKVSIRSNAAADINLQITGQAPIVQSGVAVSASDDWEVLAKLPSLVVRGKTYTDVVQLSRITLLPNTNGTLTPVTMLYWVAKGIGMIKGQGIFRILNVDNVSYELIDTNLAQ